MLSSLCLELDAILKFRVTNLIMSRMAKSMEIYISRQMGCLEERERHSWKQGGQPIAILLCAGCARP